MPERNGTLSLPESTKRDAKASSRARTEKEAIHRALAGDEEAYQEILQRYRPGLLNLVMRMVHDRQEAEDIVQETFIKAFTALASFSEEYAFSTWLYKIAVNNCIDHFRKKKLQTVSLDKPLEGKDGELKRDFPDKEPTPEGEVLRHERHLMVREAIEKLPEHYRQVIIMRHQEERSYEEIAQILGIPLGTVKARIFRARELLKKMLKPALDS